MMQQTQIQNTAHTLLMVAVGVALVDVFSIRALIGRVFFDPADFIADFIYAYLFMIGYSINFLATGSRPGAWIVKYVTGFATQVAQMNVMMLGMFYLLGQGEDVIGFMLNTLVYFSVPFGLIGYALNDALTKAEADEQAYTQVNKVEESEIQYQFIQNMAPQKVVMI